ncbi:GNAT family protein [Acinetobacter nosocomialis]|jgi:RimJ/RimL family protein N-acetyltransferase|uniref:GNAT family N-acetyltransferase n=1 Tax=Acinetobacter TaxID=469 RepID=UPI000446572E|nr:MULTISPECIES: GNAT family protein [Acinetobacter]MDQ9822737.1 GNAT family protein [Acinetobacter sp. 163]SSR44758.1 N-acetyltransferase GCN5 [Acinetobacter baumannii]AJB48783.1 GCN5 family acetyltransferase [Acinetobacter nosocomialis]EHU1211021.1 GNAT family N-acetyltransferase [Acinetobacter nosocomialis]EXH10232.1 acetyltransferase domain protein [Acinetobacter sp. 1245593]
MPLNITLSSHHIRLRLFTIEDSRDLVTAASDGELWNLPFTVVPSAETIDDYIQHALEGYQAGTVLPFVVEDIATGKVIGSTRLWKIDRKNLKLEIGSTWYSKSWQRTYANTEAKYLLLQYAFEELNCVRVQFTTDVLNEKSQNAILRLGAQKEGVVRNERIMPDGRKRNSVRFSIIDEEWPIIKDNLIKKLNYY